MPTSSSSVLVVLRALYPKPATSGPRNSRGMAKHSGIAGSPLGPCRSWPCLVFARRACATGPNGALG
ncbi:hypothetical protein C4K40_3394 [Pseudomonas sp. CMR5c]|nr:hypothetical protein C4K40_3394 [Pseudomonas sp. CMR5c]